jgi:hypothetical protein
MSRGDIQVNMYGQSVVGKKLHDLTVMPTHRAFKQIKTLRNILLILCTFTYRVFLPA